MHKSQKERAIEIQNAIRQVLFTEWDPIGISDVPEARDEYDAYVGGVYRLLISGGSADQIIEHLFAIESRDLECTVDDREHLRPVAERLLALDVFL